MKHPIRIRMFLLAACLTAAAALGTVPAAQAAHRLSPSPMPAHPELAERIRRGEMRLPPSLVDAERRHARGIDQPQAQAGRVQGTWKAIALLVQFNDNPAQVAPGYFDTLLFGQGQGSLPDYYAAVSYGSLDIVTVNLPGSLGWSPMPQSYAYYVNGQYGFGTYPHNAQRLAEDAVLAADPVVDFSNYDNDGDGWVDTVFVVHAGPGAEFSGDPNDIWSHSWETLLDPWVDGVRVNSYTTEPEYWLNPGDMTVGVYAHELGHALGLPDLYDYDYSSWGVGTWSLMGFGCWNGPYPGGSVPAFLDAWSRSQLGYLTPVGVRGTLRDAPIPAAEDSQTVYRLWTYGASGPEFFLVENRQPIGYDAALPGAGLLIWHVDELQPHNDWECAELNNWLCGSNHFRVALEQADGLWDLEHRADGGDGGDPYPGASQNRAFDLSSVPNSSSYRGSGDTRVAVTDISDSGELMTADLRVGSFYVHLPVVAR